MMKKTLPLLFLFTLLYGCSGGGGGSSSSNNDTPPNEPVNLSKSVSGGGVKGPLAGAVVTVYNLDTTQTGFKGTVVTTGATDSHAHITGLTIPNSATPPFILEFTSDADTTDITTGVYPVITTLRTAVTEEMLADADNDGKVDGSLYATPLTTMVVDVAVKNTTDSDSDGTKSTAEFLTALDDAKDKVVSTVGFGLSEGVDIFMTPPLIDESTTTAEEQKAVAEYRSAVEALTAVAYQMNQESENSTNTDGMLGELASDLADGQIDGQVDGAQSTVIKSSNLEVLDQEPSELPIPGTTKKVGDVKTVLTDETANTGSTTNTDQLATITVTLKPAEPDPDLDDDGVTNFKDAFPTDPARDKDTDKDGLADDVWATDIVTNLRTGELDVTAVAGTDVDNDDDNDGVLDSVDDFPLDAARDTDTDGDGVANDVWELDSNKKRTGNILSAISDSDDDNDGVDDVSDDFPLDATRQNANDQDNDGWSSEYDPDDNDANNPGIAVSDIDNDGIPDSFDSDMDGDGINNSDDACPADKQGAFDTDNDTICDYADPDIDGDGTANADDAFPYNALEQIDTDGDRIGNNADPDDDNDGLADTHYIELLTNTDGVSCSLLRDCDGDGRLDAADKFPDDPSEWRDFDKDGTGDNADTDDDNDGLSDTDEVAKGTKQFIADTDGDGVLDGVDAFPLDPLESLDTDGDGIGNNADTDDDNDGVPDTSDPFPLDGNRYNLDDLDNDGWPSGWDPDDNDGANPGIPFVDTDNDGTPDTDADGAQADADDDNDKVADVLDAFPLDTARDKDTDGDQLANDVWEVTINSDGIPERTGNLDSTAVAGVDVDDDDDGDGAKDDVDTFPLDPTKQLDTDGDGVDNNTDLDDDNDGVADTAEASGCELVVDCDSDGVNDDKDAFPQDNTETTDTDGDGIGNNADTDDDGDNVLDANEVDSKCILFKDCDKDGVNDDTDVFPLDPAEQADGDSDGTGDNGDNCPTVANQDQLDTDNDGQGNACDDDDDGDGISDTDETANGTDPLLADTDADGSDDGVDNCPVDANADQADIDSDQIGDVCDSDKDGDGVDNSVDNCPADSNADQADLDNDQIGDVCDSDRDGDSVANSDDAFPDDPNESSDTDGDGVGNNGDNCPGVANADQADADQDGIGDACDTAASDTEAMLNAGFSIFESDKHYDGLRGIDLLGYRYENIAWNATSGAITSDQFTWDFASSAWAAETGGNNEIVLTEAGWQDPSAGDSTVVTVNADGTATVVDMVNSSAYDQFTLEATQVDVSGLAIADSFSTQDTDFATAISSGATFSSSGATAWDVTMTPVVQGYGLWCDDGDQPASSDTCRRVRFDDGAGNMVEATALTDVMVTTSQNHGQWGVGDTDTVRYSVELVGSDASVNATGTANFYAQAKSDGSVSSAGSGTWSVISLNGETLLTFDVPQAILDVTGDDSTTRIFSVYNGYVRQGSAWGGPNGAMRMFGATARADILAAFSPPAPANSDGDSINDYEDNCPFVDNEDQADTDGNGLGDACETATNPNDMDGDGIDDAIDICLGFYNPNQDPTDNDGNGVPDECETGVVIGSDLDGDGVSDDTDNCPTVANDTQTDTDGDGVGDACQFSGTADTMENILLTGIAFTNSDSYYDPTSQMEVQEFGYETVLWDTTNGTTHTFYAWDWNNSQFTSITPDSQVLLQSAGWAVVSDAVTLTLPGDGSATATRGDGSGWSVSFTGEVMDVTGQPMGMFLDYDWAKGVDLTGTFTTGSKAIRLSFTQTTNSYQIHCGGDVNPDTGDSCDTAYDQSGPLTSLDGLLSATADGSNVQKGGFGPGQDFGVELVGNAGDTSGTANYYSMDSAGNPVSLGAGTWAITTVNSVQLLTHTPPAGIQYEGLVNFGIYNGYVREVEFSPAGNQQEVVYDTNAISQIVAVFNPSQSTAGSDMDGDGVADNVDNCPSIPNPDQTDSDGDGVGDACQSAGGGGQPVNLAKFLSSDTDNDGVIDRLDAFPTDATEQFDTDGDGTGDNADTDDDNDGTVDTSDPCPLVANATACDASGIRGANRIDWTVSALVATAEPQTGFCFGGDAVGDTGMDMLGFRDMGDGTVIINGDTRGTFDSGTGQLLASWSDTHEEHYWDDTQQQDVVLTVTEAGSVDMTFTAGSWSGTYSETKTTTGGEVNCARSEDISGNLVYQSTGSEDYNGVFGLEVAVHGWNDATQTEVTERDAHAAQMVFDAGNGTVNFADGDGYREPLEQYYDPTSGNFRYVGIVEDSYDDNGDGNMDLIQNVMVLEGVLVEPGTSSPEVWFRVRGADLVYDNTTSYTGQDASYQNEDFDAEGYGLRQTTEGYNFAMTATNSAGALVNKENIGLKNPPMLRANANSMLNIDVYEGVGTGGNLICTGSYDGRFKYRVQLDHPDMSLAQMRSAPYAIVNCQVNAGTIVASGTYTMVVRDDMGTPGDTADDIILWDDSNGTYAAVSTHTVPGVAPNRAQMMFNGSMASQTETGPIIPVSGFVNPMADITWDMPVVSGADTYYGRVFHFDTYNMTAENKEIRIKSSTNSMIIPANTVHDPVMVQMRARFDDGNNVGVVSYSQSGGVLLLPGINGLVNVELTGANGGITFQIDLHTASDKGDVNCGVPEPQAVYCTYNSNAIDWMNNTVTLNMQDMVGDITGIPNSAFTLTLQFSDAVTASASTDTGWSGDARVVNTELVARTRMRFNGRISTQLVLQNPPPSFNMAVMSSVGLSDIGGVGVSSLTLWDNLGGTNYMDVANSFRVVPIGDGTVQKTGGYYAYDSDNYFTGTDRSLPGDTYSVAITNDMNGFLPDRSFAVAYTFTDPTGIVGGPANTAVTVNGTTVSAGTGDTTATAIDISGQPVIGLGWVNALSASTEWRIAVQVVDTAGTPVLHKELRTEPLLDQDGQLSFDGNDVWTWVNPGSLDLSLMASGEVARIMLFSYDTNGALMGMSQPVYVTMPSLP